LGGGGVEISPKFQVRSLDKLPIEFQGGLVVKGVEKERSFNPAGKTLPQKVWEVQGVDEGMGYQQ